MRKFFMFLIRCIKNIVGEKAVMGKCRCQFYIVILSENFFLGFALQQQLAPHVNQEVLEGEGPHYKRQLKARKKKRVEKRRVITSCVERLSVEIVTLS
jgi:hypothetical protein